MPKALSKLPIPTEYDEQCVFVEWLTLKGIKHSAIPNSTYTTSMNQKMKNKRMGLCPGLPDLLCAIRSKNPLEFNLVFIEMKRVKGGVVSKEQQDWSYVLNHCDGVHSYVCHGADQAIKIIESYL